MANGRRSASSKNNETTPGFEAILWSAADKLRNNMDAAEYKHVVLGLIFLKYISDAFQERHDQLLKKMEQGADPEDPDEYLSENVFWVPKEARWSFLKANARQISQRSIQLRFPDSWQGGAGAGFGACSAQSSAGVLAGAWGGVLLYGKPSLRGSRA